MTLFRLFGFLLALLAYCSYTHGAVKHDLYEARVPISSQSQSAINRALRESFRQVLIKVSGDPSIISSSLIKQGVTRANDYLQQFTFDTQAGQLWYKAQYDREKVNQLIVSAEYPVWGEFRPTALMWLVIEDDKTQQRTLLDELSSAEIKPYVKSIADTRGIWINYPLMDITDVQSVNMFDVWGRFDDVVLQGSARYSADGVVIARLFPQKTLLQKEDEDAVPQLLSVEKGQSIWQLDWLFVQEDERYQGSVTGPLAKTLVEDLATNIANIFAEHYAVRIDQSQALSNNLTVTLSNLQKIEDFAAVNALFEEVSIIQRISLTSVEQDVATYRINLMGTAQDLERSLELNNNLRRQTDDFDQPLDSLSFYWTPKR